MPLIAGHTMHRSASAQGGLHQSGSACARTACAAGCAAGARAGSARSEATYAAARRASHDAGIDAAENPPALVRSMSVSAMGRL